MSDELRKAVENIESAKSDDDISDEDVNIVTNKADEIELEEKTEERLEKVFSGEGLKEKPAEESEESEKPTPEPDKEGLEEDPDKEDESTPESEDNAEKKDKDVEPEAKDEDADKGEKDVPQLSEAYYRAAIHRGWKPDEIEEFYQTNPEICVRTLGNIYEALKRSNEEFAAQGRTRKIHEAQKAAAKATLPERQTATETVKSGYKGVDLEALEKADIDPDAMAIIKAMDKQSKMLFDQVQEIKSARVPYVAPQKSRADTQEEAAIQQQIENFFRADDIKPYKDFYGDVSKDDVDWDSLSPGQKANRWAVIEMMDDLLIGARMNNRDMKIDEAMRLAHLNVSESQREKVMREKLKTGVSKRSKSLSLKPSSTNKSTDKVSPKNEEELIEATAERMRKLSW